MDWRPSSDNGTLVRYRTIFLSDIHLAAKTCLSEELTLFLRSHDAETIFLAGDVIDFWRVRRGASWRPSQTQVLRELLAKAQRGTRIVYIPGNHDSEMRGFAGSKFGAIEIRLREVYETADGRRFLVIHGDEFDVVMKKAVWLAILGDIGYEIALGANTFINMFRRAFGLPYWSLSAYLKYRVKRAVNYIGDFEDQLVSAARNVGASGVICGHIHHASIHLVDGIEYVNTGDWVESGTAVVEHFDGRLEIIRWLDRLRAVEAHPAKAPVASVTS